MDKLEKKLNRLSKKYNFKYSLFFDSHDPYDCKTLCIDHLESKIKWSYEKHEYFSLYNYSKNDYSNKENIDYILSFIS